MASVRGIRCVDVAVGNLEETAGFYGGIWGLEEVARAGGARYFREQIVFVGARHAGHGLARLLGQIQGNDGRDEPTSTGLEALVRDALQHELKWCKVRASELALPVQLYGRVVFIRN